MQVAFDKSFLQPSILTHHGCESIYISLLLIFEKYSLKSFWNINLPFEKCFLKYISEKFFRNLNFIFKKYFLKSTF